MEECVQCFSVLAILLVFLICSGCLFLFRRRFPGLLVLLPVLVVEAYVLLGAYLSSQRCPGVGITRFVC